MPPSTGDVAANACTVIVLICIAALCSGLNLGLLSIDPFILEDLHLRGTPKDKWRAKVLKPLVQDHHLLIVVILLGNAICLEILPLVLEPLVGFLGSVLLTTCLCVLICEIFPQAIIYRNRITICAILAPVVWVMIFCSFALSYPLARILDVVLGKWQVKLYDKNEIIGIIELHGLKEGRWAYNKSLTCESDIDGFQRSDSVSDEEFSHVSQQTGGHGGILSHEETNMIKHVLQLDQATVQEAMRPICRMYMLNLEQSITPTKFKEVCETGYSRIPVYARDRKNVTGILQTRQLILQNPQSQICMRDLYINPEILKIPSNSSLLTTLQTFRQENRHMSAVVNSQSFEIVGFITLHDILKRVIGEQNCTDLDAERSSNA